MFPWLPFLTFPDSKRRKRQFQIYFPPQNESNSILCSVEVFSQIPNKEIEIHLAPTRLSNRSTPTSPIPSTSSKSPRSGSGLASSRPPSARDKKPLFAPPIEPKPSRNQRKGLETSSAMLELFGGTQPLIQITTSSKDKNDEKLEEPMKEAIPTEWEIIKTHPSTSSAFQVRIINSTSIEQMFDEKNTDWLAWLISICFAIYLLEIALRAGLYGRRILDNRRS
uniref:Uncharacterized protein n=1 Tax=Panagrolaimus sp. ES5 TaxID=591445 RepID=A0AC34F8F9_9BILA